MYTYYITAGNECGESGRTAVNACTIALPGDEVVIVCNAGTGTTRFYNVYRTAANGTVAKFIGRVLASGATNFNDRGNKIQGFSTGFLIEPSTMERRQLAGFSRLKTAVTDLSQPEAYYQFETLVITEPRKNILMENVTDGK